MPELVVIAIDLSVVTNALLLEKNVAEDNNNPRKQTTK